MPEKPSKLMPALYGGVIMGAISGIPFLNLVNCLCCAGVILGGFMSVFFYQKDLPAGGPSLTNGDALQLGALAGVFGAVVGVILTIIFHFALGAAAGEATAGMIMSIYDQLGILDKMPPEALEQMQQGMRDQALSALTIIPPFIIDPLFGLIGGLIGYSVYKPKGPAANVQPPAAA
ncbi:MAG: hypothetical protein AB1428_02445 [Bacteroidota bacterium]